MQLGGFQIPIASTSTIQKDNPAVQSGLGARDAGPRSQGGERLSLANSASIPCTQIQNQLIVQQLVGLFLSSSSVFRRGSIQISII